MNIGETLNAALAAHRANRLADAKSGYDAVLSLAPDNADALYLRGMIHLVEGELDLGEALTKRAIAAKPFMLGHGSHLTVTASLGVSSLAAEQDTVDDLLKRADRALYRAKREGRNRVVPAAA